MGKNIDLTGKVFNRLTVLERSPLKTNYGKPLWLCVCSCGSMTKVMTVDLTRGKKKSCGCLRNDCKSNLSHGQGSPKNKTREYRIWQGIIQRTTNKNAPAYHHYGGRGITVCDQWRDFNNFFNDMGKCPTEKHSIDRIDNNGNYEPVNCKWALSKTQQRNRRNNRWIEFKGEKMILAAWADRLGTGLTNLHSYLKSNSFESAFEYYSKKKIGFIPNTQFVSGLLSL